MSCLDRVIALSGMASCLGVASQAISRFRKARCAITACTCLRPLGFTSAGHQDDAAQKAAVGSCTGSKSDIRYSSSKCRNRASTFDSFASAVSNPSVFFLESGSLQVRWSKIFESAIAKRQIDGRIEQSKAFKLGNRLLISTSRSKNIPLRPAT